MQNYAECYLKNPNIYFMAVAADKLKILLKCDNKYVGLKNCMCVGRGGERLLLRIDQFVTSGKSKRRSWEWAYNMVLSCLLCCLIARKTNKNAVWKFPLEARHQDKSITTSFKGKATEIIYGLIPLDTP